MMQWQRLRWMRQQLSATGTRSLAVTASGGARRLSDAVASLQQMVAGANNNSFMLSFRPRIVTDIVFTVRVANQFVQYLNVSVLPVRCPAVNTVVDPSGLTCTCVPGSYFTDDGVCVRCPPGTFKPEASHGGKPTCRMCLQNHFCNGGQGNVTGACTTGFDCRGGLLKLKDGFWSPISASEWQHNLTLIAYACPNDAACAGGDFFGHAQSFIGCSAGHQGVLCNECVDGQVGRCGTCIHCPPNGLSVVAIILVQGLVLFLLSVLTAVLVQEDSGKSQVTG
jgi:hypothetical protein